VVVCT